MNDRYPTALVPEIRPEFGYGSNLRVWLRNCFHVLETGTCCQGRATARCRGFVFISTNKGVREIDLHGLEFDESPRARRIGVLVAQS
jgi:hypothetical protein